MLGLIKEASLSALWFRLLYRKAWMERMHLQGV